MITQSVRLSHYVGAHKQRVEKPVEALKAQARLLVETDLKVNDGVAVNEPYRIVNEGRVYKAFVVAALGMHVILITESDSANLVTETVV